MANKGTRAIGAVALRVPSDALVLGLTQLTKHGMVLRTRRRFEVASIISVGLRLDGKGGAKFLQLKGCVVDQQLVRDSAIGKIFEVVVVFDLLSAEEAALVEEAVDGGRGVIPADVPVQGGAGGAERIGVLEPQLTGLFGLN
jgi:hypothetical protein